MSTRLRIVVTGLIAQHPRLGGVAWDYLQYPAGLARLGHDVYYLEDSGQWPYLLEGEGDNWIARDPHANVRHLAAVMARFGLAGRWAYRFPTADRWFGMADAEREAVVASADVLLNVSGSLEWPERYRGRGRLVYLDTDPVFTQVKLASGDQKFQARVAAHDVHFSFGERVGDLPVPTDHVWRPTRQPILLDEWQLGSGTRDAFTTVMSWTSYAPLVWEGRAYAQKDVEFSRFLDLPRRVPSVPLEVALGATRHADWEGEDDAAGTGERPSPADRLRRAGWRVTDAFEVCADVDAYRAYVATSRGEWSVAKQGYVVGRPGWFSCRSACYLAAGRPVVVQDTGFTDVLPTGAGLLAFRTIDEAASALREVAGDWERHARAARRIAEEHFDAATVLPALLDAALERR